MWTAHDAYVRTGDLDGGEWPARRTPSTRKREARPAVDQDRGSTRRDEHRPAEGRVRSVPPRQSAREQVEHPILAEAADDQPRGRELGFALRAADNGDRELPRHLGDGVRAGRRSWSGVAGPPSAAPGPACRVSRGASPSRRRPRAGSPSRMRRAHRTNDHRGGTARQVVSRGRRRGSGAHMLRRSGRGVRAPRARAPECHRPGGCSVARRRARAMR